MDVHTLSVLAVQNVVGRHMLKVEPLNAILDPQYFVRAVHECVMAVLAMRQEAAAESEAVKLRWAFSVCTPTILILGRKCVLYVPHLAMCKVCA